MPGYAPFVYSILGNTYHSLGDFKKAIEYHTEHLAIAKEVGNRAGEGGAYGNLGNAHQSLGVGLCTGCMSGTWPLPSIFSI